MPLPELIANSPTPGSDAAIAQLAAPVNTTPAANTVETWTMSGAAPDALQANPGQWRGVIGSEIVLVDASTTNATSWSVTRGVEGSPIATHPNGASIYHKPTAQALLNIAASGVKAIGYLDIIGHSHIADAGSTMPDFGTAHKIDGFLQPALFRNIAIGGAVCSQHDQGNGFSGDGGWAAVARELHRQENITPWLQTTLAASSLANATTISVTSAANVAGNQYIVIGQGANLEVARVNGFAGTTLTVSAGTGAPGSIQGLRNAHSAGDPVYVSMSNFGYLAKSEMVVCGYGANDLAQLGPFANGTVGTGGTAGSSRGLVPLQHAYRFILAVARCSVIYRDNHPNCVYGTGWTSTAVNTTGVSYPPNYAFGPFNSQNYHSTTTAGSQVSFSTEPGFPGGTVCCFFISNPSGFGASWNVSVSGATTRTVNGAIDTRNVNAVQKYALGAAPNSYYTGCVYRITGLAPGVNTITLTAATLNSTAYFLGWGIEAPQPPLIFCHLDPRPMSYAIWNTWAYQTRAPFDNNGYSTQTATVAAGAGTANGSVTLGTAVTIGTTTTNSQAVYPGDTITIGTGATQETRRVVAVDSTTTLHVDSNFANAHTGQPCVIGLQDADYAGGGSSRLGAQADAQGAISVPGMWSIMQSVVNEFDQWTQTIDIDSVFLKNQAYFNADLVHYTDQGHAVVAAQTIKALQALSWTIDQIATPTVPMTKTWIPIYGDSGATPTPSGSPAWTSGGTLTNFYTSDQTYPRSGFYKDMRTRTVTVRLFTDGAPSSAANAWNVPLFQLPVGYRPAARIQFEGGSSSGAGPPLFEIDSSGNVYVVENPSANFMSLYASFLAEA